MSGSLTKARSLSVTTAAAAAAATTN